MRELRSLTIALGLAAALAAPAAAQQVVDLPARDRPLEGRPQTLYSVGRSDGADWEMFGAVAGVAFDAEENLYVLDRAGYRVLVFDPAGRFVRQFGKQGGGPGELQAPLAMTVTADGVVAITDVGRRAYSLFGRDGTFRRNIPFPEEQGIPAPVLRPHPRNGFVAAVRPMMIGRPGSPPPAAAGPDRMPILWQPTAAEARASILFAAPVARPQVRTSGSANNRTVRVGMPPVFTPTAHWGVLPGGGVVVAHDDTYSATVISATGAVERVLRRPIHPRKPTERDRQSARERRREQMESGAGMIRVVNENGRMSTSVGGSAPREEIERVLREMEFAATVPVVQGVAADPQGRIWIERTGPVAMQPGPVDLLSAEGRYIGTLQGVRLPVAFSRGGRAAWIETDDLGVERVVVRRLPDAWR